MSFLNFKKLIFDIFNNDISISRYRGDNVSESLYSFGNYLPYRTYNDETKIYQNEHSKSVIIEAYPLTGASDETMDLFYSLMQTMLPEGVILHFLLQASPFIGEELDRYIKIRNSDNDVITELSKTRINYLKKRVFNPLTVGQEIVLRNFKLYISVIFDNELKFEDRKIRKITGNIIGTLKRARMFPKLLEPDKLIKIIQSTLLIDGRLYQNNKNWNPFETLNDQMLENNHRKIVFPNRIVIDDGKSEESWEIRNYRVSNFGMTSKHLAGMTDLVGGNFDIYNQIGCPFSMSIIIKVLNQKEENLKILKDMIRTSQRANDAWTVKFKPGTLQDSKTARYCVQKFQEHERLVQISFQSSIFCRSTEADDHETSLTKLFQSSSQRWNIEPNFLLQIPMLIWHLPMAQSNKSISEMIRLKRMDKMWSKNVVGMLPIIADSNGLNNPRIIGASRRGQLFSFDPFKAPRGNYNVCVAGISGAGKSVTMQEYVTSLIGTGAQVFIIDIGRSYQKITKILSGDFIEFTKERAVCLNPFSNESDDNKEEIVEFMTLLIKVMISPDSILEAIQISYIEQAISCAWEKHKNKANIDTIVEFLKEHKDQRARDLAESLFSYTSDGQYGKYFNGESNIDLSNSLVVFELEEIDQNKTLKNLLFILLMNRVTQKMFLGGRKRQISLVVDEAWAVLKGQYGGEIIENMARKARKYNGSLNIATQGISDFFDSLAGQAAYNNSYWKIIQMQNKAKIEKLVKNDQLDLTDYEKRLLNSVTTEHGEYSELMIKGDGGECSVMRLTLDPYSRILYSTQPDDFQAVNRYVNDGMSLSQSILKRAKELYENEM